MSRLFHSRGFIAVALLLLVGAVRCVNVCEFGFEAAPAAAAEKSCHHEPPATPTDDSPAKTCSHLSMNATPEAPAPMYSAPPIEPAFVLLPPPLLTSATQILMRRQAPYIPPGAHPLPLRL